VDSVSAHEKKKYPSTCDRRWARRSRNKNFFSISMYSFIYILFNVLAIFEVSQRRDLYRKSINLQADSKFQVDDAIYILNFNKILYARSPVLLYRSWEYATRNWSISVLRMRFTVVLHNHRLWCSFIVVTNLLLQTERAYIAHCIITKNFPLFPHVHTSQNVSYQIYVPYVCLYYILIAVFLLLLV
jgi:hypothetical protein